MKGVLYILVLIVRESSCTFTLAWQYKYMYFLSAFSLQALLGKTVEVTDDDNVERCTFGIEISTMQLSGKDLFSVWDFAGQVESFITHQFFISTQSTVFTVLVDLTKELEKQRDQLMCWLGFIKMRNLGQVSYLFSS